MDFSYLEEGERMIYTSKDSKLALTSFRIRYQVEESGKLKLESIVLEKISSIKLHYIKHPILHPILFALSLGIFILGVFMTLYIMSNSYSYGGLQIGFMVVPTMLSFILAVIYIGTKKYALSISSDSGNSIDYAVGTAKKEALLDLFNLVEKTQLEKLRSI